MLAANKDRFNILAPILSTIAIAIQNNIRDACG